MPPMTPPTMAPMSRLELGGREGSVQVSPPPPQLAADASPDTTKADGARPVAAASAACVLLKLLGVNVSSAAKAAFTSLVGGAVRVTA